MTHVNSFSLVSISTGVLNIHAILLISRPPPEPFLGPPLPTALRSSSRRDGHGPDRLRGSLIRPIKSPLMGPFCNLEPVRINHRITWFDPFRRAAIAHHHVCLLRSHAGAATECRRCPGPHHGAPPAAARRHHGRRSHRVEWNRDRTIWRPPLSSWSPHLHSLCT